MHLHVCATLTKDNKIKWFKIDCLLRIHTYSMQTATPNSYMGEYFSLTLKMFV